VGFSAPVAALYDPKRDVYWVSNQGSTEDSPGGHGFISRLDAEGNLVTLNYIDGSRKEQPLSAPRAIDDDELWVADRGVVRIFNADTGVLLRSLPVGDGRELSNIVLFASGMAYVSDLGAPIDAAGTDGATAGRLYQVNAQGTVQRVGEEVENCGPGPMARLGGQLWVACASNDRLLRFRLGSDDTLGPEPPSGVEVGQGLLRGMLAMPNGQLFVSSWQAQAIIAVTPSGTISPVLVDLEAPGDPGYDSGRNRLIVPLVRGHALALFELPRDQTKREAFHP
jgi:hypothetical protein